MSVVVWCEEHPGKRSVVAVLDRGPLGWERVGKDGEMVSGNAGGRQIIDAATRTATRTTSEEIHGFEVVSLPDTGAMFRWKLSCPRGCRAPVFRADRIELFLDGLRAAGVTRVTLADLDARVNGSRTEP